MAEDKSATYVIAGITFHQAVTDLSIRMGEQDDDWQLDAMQGKPLRGVAPLPDGTPWAGSLSPEPVESPYKLPLEEHLVTGKAQGEHDEKRHGARGSTRLAIAPSEELQKHLGRGWSYEWFKVYDPEGAAIIEKSGVEVDRFTVGRGLWSTPEGTEQPEYDLDFVAKGTEHDVEVLGQALAKHWKQKEVLAIHYGRGNAPVAHFRMDDIGTLPKWEPLAETTLSKIMEQYGPVGWHLKFEGLGLIQQMVVAHTGDGDKREFRGRMLELGAQLEEDGWARRTTIRKARVVSFKDGNREVLSEAAT